MSEAYKKMQVPVQSAKSVATIAAASRIAMWLWGWLCTTTVEPYDTSGDLLQPNKRSDAKPLDALILRAFAPFANWDGAYFTYIADHGYDTEQFHAFFPLLPSLLSGVAKYGLYPLRHAGLLSHGPAVLLAGGLVSFVSFIAAAVLLQRLTLSMFKHERLAYVSALLFCVGPGGVFMSATYTESLFAALTFTGLLACQKALEAAEAGTAIPKVVPRLFIGAAAFALAAATRSNGLLLAGFQLYYLLRCWSVAHERWSLTDEQPPSSSGARVWAKTRHVGGHLLSWVMLLRTSFIMIVTIAAPYVLFQYWAYFLHCSPIVESTRHRSIHKVLEWLSKLCGFHLPPVTGPVAEWSAANGSAPWCAEYNVMLSVGEDAGLIDRCMAFTTLPNIYGYVQAKYWEVGLFRYYQAKHVPQFLLAAPMLVLAASCVHSYFASWTSIDVTEDVALLRMIRSILLPCKRLKQPTDTAANDVVTETHKNSEKEAKELSSQPVDTCSTKAEGLRRRTRGKPVQQGIEQPVTAVGGDSSVLSEGQSEQPPMANHWQAMASAKLLLLPHIVHLLILALVALLVMNVQVTTRFIAAACPVIYWHAAALWLDAEERELVGAAKKSDESAPSSKGSKRKAAAALPPLHLGLGWWDFRRLYLTWTLAYSLLGTALFVLFYPWT